MWIVTLSHTSLEALTPIPALRRPLVVPVDDADVLHGAIDAVTSTNVVGRTHSPELFDPLGPA